MKLTKRQLKRLIKEEIRNVLNESVEPSLLDSIRSCVDENCALQIATVMLTGGDVSDVWELDCVKAAMACIDQSKFIRKQPN